MKFRQTLLIGIACLILSSLFVSCQSIYDELSKCPQGLVFSFSSETPCGEALSLKDMKDVEIQIYDAQNNQVATFNESDLKINSNKMEIQVPFYVPGTYSITVWGRQDGNQTYASTDKASMALKDKSTTIEHNLAPLFFGRIESHTIKKLVGTKYDTLAVNMLPYISDLRLKVKNLFPSTHYRVAIHDDNTAFNADGSVISTPVVYTRLLNEDMGIFTADFNTLKLRRESSAYLVITDLDQNKKLFKVSLSKLFDAYEIASGKVFNPDCEHDLDLDITVDTYQRVTIKINGWNLVLRNVDLG